MEMRMAKGAPVWGVTTNRRRWHFRPADWSRRMKEAPGPRHKTDLLGHSWLWLSEVLRSEWS